MKRIATLFLNTLLGVFLIQNVSAQTDSVQVRQKKERKIMLFGSVYDSFTKVPLEAKVWLLREDSTLVDSTRSFVGERHSYYDLKVPARNAKYIIKGTCEGYEDAYMAYNLHHIARNNEFSLPRLLMKKRQDVYKDVDLDGVTITGTKVKIAYRGDTIVYNASAFNLPEGSMLDGLVRQMPGAELKSNGDIYINGQKVDYLTLNGKDFFKGNNKVMLDNLPYYIVQDVKVYHKSTRQSEMVGRDVEKKDYVMDVSLKREYHRGYLLNAEGGMGTENRYLGRIFGLYYDDHNRVATFANLNNINENRHPGERGDWSPSKMPQGLRATKQIGLNVSAEDADKNWEEELSSSVEWSDADDYSRSTSEVFSTGGNILGGSESLNRQKDFHFTMENRLSMLPKGLMGLVSADYINGDRNSMSNDSTYRDFLINQSRRESLNKYQTLHLAGQLDSYKKFDWGDYIQFFLRGEYERQKPSDNWSRQRTVYGQSGDSEQREYYGDTHQSGYSYLAGGNYRLQLLNNWSVEFSLNYRQEQKSTYNSNYRLDWLGDARQHDLGWLPSTHDVLIQALDADNSNTHHNLSRRYTGVIYIDKNYDNGILHIGLPIMRQNEQMTYHNARLDPLARRSDWLFQPHVLYAKGSSKGSIQIEYNMNMSRPDFATLMPDGNNINPLAVRINNPGLKNTITHTWQWRYQHRCDSVNLRWWFNGKFDIVQRAWGTRTTYNPQTGGYTYMNDNVNGNWTGYLQGGLSGTLDKARRLTYFVESDLKYEHSVDFDIAYDAASRNLSKVNTLTTGAYAQLEYSYGELTVGGYGQFNSRHSRSQRDGFEALDAFDYEYGGWVKYRVPWLKVFVSTDLKMFSKRGYYSELMNTDDLVWNAELSRSFLKDKLTLKLQAFDLLHQLSKVQYSVNAQGRTEIWNNCIPRYLMMTIGYRF